MQSEFRPLGDFVTLASGNTPSKANKRYWGGATPWVSAKDMGDFWIEDAEDHLTPEGVAVASRLVPAGTVLLLARGMTLHKRVPICRLAKPSTFNQDVKAVLPKAGLSGRFLPYLLVGNHDRLHERVDSAGHGTGRLNTDALLSFPVYVPSWAEQNGIADIGEAIDDRLRLLRQTNATLESIAQALFKSWFIDFDPVRAKVEGRESESMDAATAALFPAEFEESALGLIPKGWRVGCILDTANLLSGGTPKTDNPDYWGGPILWASAKDVSQSSDSVLVGTERTITEAGLVKSSTRLIPALATVVVARGATTGRMVMIGREMAMNQTCYALTSRCDTPVVLHLLLRNAIGGLLNAAHGSVFDTITTSTFAQSRCVLAPPPVQQRLERLVRPMFEQIAAGVNQAQSLASIRDALLPRLISGKLRLPEAQEQVEDALA